MQFLPLRRKIYDKDRFPFREGVFVCCGIFSHGKRYSMHSGQLVFIPQGGKNFLTGAKYC